MDSLRRHQACSGVLGSHGDSRVWLEIQGVGPRGVLGIVALWPWGSGSFQTLSTQTGKDSVFVKDLCDMKTSVSVTYYPYLHATLSGHSFMGSNS